MEEIISEYQKLISYLDQEHDHIALCFRHELLKVYRDILETEKEKLEEMLRTLY